MDTVYKIAMYASFVIAGLIVALNAIAPLTKTEWDNRVLRALVWLHDVALKLVLPQHDAVVKQPADKV